MAIDVAQTLQRGRDSFGRRSWDEAYRALSLIDDAEPLRPEDLELAATAAYLTGRDENYLKLLERAHRAYQDAGDNERGRQVGGGIRPRGAGGCDRQPLPRP